MKKTKFWLFIFVFLFAGAIVGSILILKVANNQTFDEFELVAVEGYDASAIEGISFDVEYELEEEGLHHFWDKGDKCEFKYVNGTIKDLRFTEINESEYPFEIFQSYELIGEDRRVGIREGDNLCFFSVADRINAYPSGRNIAAAIPDELRTKDGQYKYHHEKKFWSVGEDYYFFENGAIFTVDEEELCSIGLYRVYEKGWENKYYPTIYTVPSEVEGIVGCGGGEYIYLTAVGNVTEDGYTLYSYIIDAATGRTIDRQLYEKELSNGATDVNELSFDYLVTAENYTIVTITQLMGEQDMYVISHRDNKCTIEYLDTEEMLADDLYISGLLKAKSNGEDTLYLIYAESQIGKTDYDINWAKRNIMKRDDIMHVQIPSGYEGLGEVDFNGITFVAIKNGEVAYKGYFSSETAKTMFYMSNTRASVENIEINLP